MWRGAAMVALLDLVAVLVESLTSRETASNERDAVVRARPHTHIRASACHRHCHCPGRALAFEHEGRVFSLAGKAATATQSKPAMEAAVGAARERLEGLFYATDDASVAAMIGLSGTTTRARAHTLRATSRRRGRERRRRRTSRIWGNTRAWSRERAPRLSTSVHAPFQCAEACAWSPSPARTPRTIETEPSRAPACLVSRPVCARRRRRRRRRPRHAKAGGPVSVVLPRPRALRAPSYSPQQPSLSLSLSSPRTPPTPPPTNKQTNQAPSGSSWRSPSASS